MKRTLIVTISMSICIFGSHSAAQGQEVALGHAPTEKLIQPELESAAKKAKASSGVFSRTITGKTDNIPYKAWKLKTTSNIGDVQLREYNTPNGNLYKIVTKKEGTTPAADELIQVLVLNEINLPLKFNDASKDSTLTNIVNQISRSKNTAEPYSGSLGNEYFVRYRDSIVLPSLETYLKYLIARYNGKIPQNIFENVITELGNQRKIIAEKTNSPMTDSFGKLLSKKNYLIEKVQAFDRWNQYLMEQFSLLSEASRLKNDSSARVEPAHIRNLLEKSQFLSSQNITIKVEKYQGGSDRDATRFTLERKNNDLNSSLGTFEVIYDRGAIPKYEDPLRIVFTHVKRTVGQAFVEQALSKALSPKLTKEQLKEALASFCLYYNHSSWYERGQASVGEWIMSAISRVHGYELGFNDKWGGMQKNAMAPDMYALSYQDKNAFVRAFEENSKLSP